MSDASGLQPAERRDCPDEAKVAAFVAGDHSEERRSELEAHLGVCDECRRLVSALAAAKCEDRGVDSAEPHAPTLLAAGQVAAPADFALNSTEAQLLAPGRVIAEKYAIEAVLGAGGMGVVARARHLVLGTYVVVKLLRAPDASDESVRRFLREARAGAALDSEHIARVIDAGLCSGRPYLVLEHLEGRDLAQELEERGALPVEEAVCHVLQVCEALATAHARGIVHRDIKPANLFLTRSVDGSPLVKVLDFGIAKAAEDSGVATMDSGLTHTSAIMGSPRYMSPEQLEHTAAVDARTDLWSLGAVLYELCAGKPAFDAPTLAALATAILTRPPPPLDELRPDLPQGLGRVIARCLEKDRDLRFSSVAELARALLSFAPVGVTALVERIERIAANARSSVRPTALARSDALATSVAGTAGPRPAPVRTLGWVTAAVVVIVGLGIWSAAGRAPGAEVRLRSAISAWAPRPAASPDHATALAPASATVPPDASQRGASKPPRRGEPRAPGLASAASPLGIHADGLLDRK